MAVVAVALFIVVDVIVAAVVVPVVVAVFKNLQVE